MHHRLEEISFLKFVRALSKRTKLLGTFLAILLLFSFGISDLAYARGGCFVGGTPILTSEGYKPLEQLHQGDGIISYNLITHQPEEGIIGEVQVLSSADYFLINGRIKVTATHPFYVQTSRGINLMEAQHLKVGYQLLGEGESHPVISSIKHVKESITVYNLVSVNPNHNFYADGFLVHNKGGGTGGAGGGGVRMGPHGSGSGAPLNSKTIPSLIVALSVLVAVLLPFVFLREISNFVRFSGKKFTDEEKLIEFAETVNSSFTNQYSLRYSKNNEDWNLIPIESELDEQHYQHILSKLELIEQIHRLFIQYQLDWTMKNFLQMVEYVAEPFYSKQRRIFQHDFGNNFDVIYRPELLEVVPISYKQEQAQHIFRLQVNAKMINFELSLEGYVLSGEPSPRSFTEYWDIGVDSAGKWYLINILYFCHLFSPE